MALATNTLVLRTLLSMNQYLIITFFNHNDNYSLHFLWVTHIYCLRVLVTGFAHSFTGRFILLYLIYLKNYSLRISYIRIMYSITFFCYVFLLLQYPPWCPPPNFIATFLKGSLSLFSASCPLLITSEKKNQCVRINKCSKWLCQRSHKSDSIVLSHSDGWKNNKV